MDQMWRGSLNVAVAEPHGMDAWQEAKKLATNRLKKLVQDNPCKGTKAKVFVARAEASQEVQVS